MSFPEFIIGARTSNSVSPHNPLVNMPSKKCGKPWLPAPRKKFVKQYQNQTFHGIWQAPVGKHYCKLPEPPRELVNFAFLDQLVRRTPLLPESPGAHDHFGAVWSNSSPGAFRCKEGQRELSQLLTATHIVPPTHSTHVTQILKAHFVKISHNWVALSNIFYFFSKTRARVFQ